MVKRTKNVLYSVRGEIKRGDIINTININIKAGRYLIKAALSAIDKARNTCYGKKIGSSSSCVDTPSPEDHRQ